VTLIPAWPPSSTRYSTLIAHQADWARDLPLVDTSGRLYLKVPINAFAGAALDRFASKE